MGFALQSSAAPSRARGATAERSGRPESGGPTPRGWTRSTLASVLIVLGLLPGCANVIDGSAAKRIREGDATEGISPPTYRVEIANVEVEAETRDDEALAPIVDEPAVRLQATMTTTRTTRTPRTEEQVESILPYSPLRETVEFVSSPFYLLWAIPTWGWNQWFAMLNPALNSESMWSKTRVERVTESNPIAPRVETESQTVRVAQPVGIRIDGLPPIHVAVAAEEAGSRVDVVDLLTAPLFEPPATVLASMSVEGQAEPSVASLPIQPGLAERLFRAQRSLLDPSSGRHSPAELATAILRLSELGFEKRSASLRAQASMIFGTEVMNQRMASEYIVRANEQKTEGDWTRALENIAAARALDKRVMTDWDLLEADVLEKRALHSLGAGDYDLARAGLLRATAVDPDRQARLAPFITMSIEASDRAKERQATQESREAFLAVERERADAEAAIARSAAALRPPAAPAVSLAPGANQTN